MGSIVASQKYLTIENYCSPRRNLLLPHGVGVAFQPRISFMSELQIAAGKPLPQTKFQRIAENENSGNIAYYV